MSHDDCRFDLVLQNAAEMSPLAALIYAPTFQSLQ